MKYVSPLLILAGLLLVGAAPAGAGYEYRGGYYWSGNYAYNRVQYYHPGYYSCGYYYQPYYTYEYQYDHEYTPPASYAPKAPQYGPNWKAEAIAYAKERDDLATYLLTLKALGVNGQQYAFQQGYYGYNYVPTYSGGATQYGYSVKQIAEAYGALDTTALLQQQGRLAQGAQEYAVTTSGQVSDRIKEVTGGQLTVAKIIAEGNARAKVLEASKLAPSASVETTVEGAAGTGTTSVPGGTGVESGTAATSAAGMTDAQFLALRQARCGACHSGSEAKAKLDMTKDWKNYDANLRALIEERITTTNPEKRMPRTKDGKPADLPVNEKIEFVRYCERK